MLLYYPKNVPQTSPRITVNVSLFILIKEEKS